MSIITIGRMDLVNEDDRRKIEEFESPHCSLSVSRLTILRDSVLGNHFHKNKTETFVVIKGSGWVLQRSVNEEGERITDTKLSHLHVGSVVVIPPLTAHTFGMRKESELLCFSSATFDPLDLHFHNLTPLKTKS